MVAAVPQTGRIGEPRYIGLRLSADEFDRLADDGHRYELVDGVVVMSPSPTPEHQGLLGYLLTEIEIHLRKHPVGRVWAEVDVRFGPSLVYRPDLTFVRTENLARTKGRIEVVPDLVVEVISPSSEARDMRTKRSDYERLGVREYWIVDATRGTVTFYVSRDGRFEERTAKAGRFESVAVSGLALDVDGVVRAMNRS